MDSGIVLDVVLVIHMRVINWRFCLTARSSVNVRLSPLD